jgi:microcystin degradation protein MlrC
MMSRRGTEAAGAQAAGRVFIAALGTETNSFSSIPTGLEAFRAGALIERDASMHDTLADTRLVQLFRNLAKREGREVIESLFAEAQPGGLTVRAVYERLRDSILEDLRAALPVSMVILSLHGGMIAEGYPDCEGDLLAHIRSIAGADAIIGAELDPHCHLTELMVRNADLLIMYKHYPHVDLIERGEDLYRLCSAADRGTIKPVSAVFDCRMVGVYRTTIQPMADLVQTMIDAEREPGILSVSFAHGFPWGDTLEAGSKMLVIADNDLDLAAQYAETLGRAVYARRSELLPRLHSVDEALNEACQNDELTVLADTADNAGGGAPGDATYLLRAMLLRHDLGRSALGVIYDPGAVELCESAGVGAKVSLRIGGKLGVTSGDPIDVEAMIMAVKHDHYQTAFGAISPLGTCAWVRVGEIDIVISKVRTQTFSPNAFKDIGIELEKLKIIAVKSSEHFRTEFSQCSNHILSIATPGTLQMEFSTIPYLHKGDLFFFPRMDDPLG